MNILEEFREVYKIKSTETIEGWLCRLIIDFLNIDDAPYDKALISLGASSLSSAILIDLIKRETGASLELSQAMGISSISSLSKDIYSSPSTYPSIKNK